MNSGKINMAWSKVKLKERKPLNWWFHKILCELGWLVRAKDGYVLYHYHLDKLCAHGFNLYGEKIN